MAAYRQAGYTPFDRDNDFAVLDSDVHRLKTLQLPTPYKFVWKPNTFRLEPLVEGWPLMDGVIYESNLSASVAYDRVSKSMITEVVFDLKDMQHYQELNFYDGKLRAPANALTYLKRMYGDDCLEVQVNKCARQKGTLFLSHPKQCNYPCYRGALDFPHITRENIKRGEILFTDE